MFTVVVGRINERKEVSVYILLVILYILITAQDIKTAFYIN